MKVIGLFTLLADADDLFGDIQNLYFKEIEELGQFNKLV